MGEQLLHKAGWRGVSVSLGPGTCHLHSFSSAHPCLTLLRLCQVLPELPACLPKQGGGGCSWSSPRPQPQPILRCKGD